MPSIDLHERRNTPGHQPGPEDDLDLERRNGPRRTAHRLNLRLWTEGRDADGKLLFHSCSNLSPQGIFIETPTPYPLDQLVDIEFNLPGVTDPIRVQGRVTSIIDEDNGVEIMGNGFRFEGISQADQLTIGTYVAANRSANPV